MVCLQYFSSRLGPPTPSTATSRGSRGRDIQDGEQNLRTGPLTHIDIFRSDSARGFLHRVMMSAAGAEITFPMLRDFETQSHRPQVRGLAKELDWRFRIVVLQFAIGGTHTAQRVNSALHTFGNALPRPGALPQKKARPAFLHASRANVVGILMRQHADAHLPVGIECEGIYAPAAGIYRVALPRSRA